MPPGDECCASASRVSHTHATRMPCVRVAQEPGYWHIRVKEERSCLDHIADTFDPIVDAAQCFWTAEDPVLHTWVPYPVNISRRIEHAYQTRGELQLLVLDMYGEHYTVDFDKMRQVSPPDGALRVSGFDCVPVPVLRRVSRSVCPGACMGVRQDVF